MLRLRSRPLAGIPGIPALCIEAGADRVVSSGVLNGLALAGLRPHVVTIRGSPHLVAQRFPREVWAAITMFLAERRITAAPGGA